MAWVKNGTPNTLGSTGDDIDITDLEAKKFNQFMLHTLQDSANITQKVNFNNNTNSVYARRYSGNGASDSTSVSESNIGIQTVGFGEAFTMMEVSSISGEDKLLLAHLCIRTSTGAATAPQRNSSVGKFVPSPDADITRIDINNNQTGDYAVDSNLSAIGTD